MTYEQRLELFAKIAAIGIALVVLIDLGAEFHIKAALRLKWSAAWYAISYVTMGCAIALVIDVLTK